MLVVSAKSACEAMGSIEQTLTPSEQEQPLVIFHLHDCSKEVLESFAEAAREEKRDGWVSEALVRLMVRTFAIARPGVTLIHVLRDESGSRLVPTTHHFQKQDVKTMAKAIAAERSYMQMVSDRQVRLGHAIANRLARSEGGVLKEGADKGADVRSAVLQGLTSKACLLTGMPAPKIVNAASLSVHTSADAYALETQLRVMATAKRMALLFEGDVTVSTPVIVRLNPRSTPSTAVVVTVQLPGLHPVCFAWPAERPR